MISSAIENNVNDSVGEDSLTLFLEDIRQFPLLSAEEEKELARRFVAGDDNALHRLTSCNLRLVVSIAKEYTGRGVPLLELIQGGNYGLVLAARRFDPDKDCRFSTYASEWIRQEVRETLRQNGCLIRVASYTAERLRKVQNAKTVLERENGEKPTVDEIAAFTGFSAETVQELLRYDVNVISVETEIGEDSTLEALIGDPTGDEMEKRLAHEELTGILNLLISRLDERHQEVIRLHFGLNGERRHSLEEISKVLNVSKERVRQLEAAAKDRLKKMGVDFGLEDFLDD